MYVDSGASDDRGASGPVRESSAPTRMGLQEIAAMAKELSDAVADPAVKDLLDEARVVALTLNATATKRPLSDAENSVWAELETVLRGIVENQALGANLAAPTQRIRVAGAAPPGPPGPLGPGGPPVPPVPPGPPVPGGLPVPPGPVNIKLPLSQADQQKQDFISNFDKNDYMGGLYRDMRLTMQILGPIVEQSRLVNKYDKYVGKSGVPRTIYTTKSGWNKGGIFSAMVSKIKNMATLKEKFDYVVLILDTFKGYGGIPP